MKKRLFVLLLCAALLLGLASPLAASAAPEASAPDASAPGGQAEATLLSTKRSIKSSEGFPDISVIYDDKLTASRASEASASLTLENSEGIGSLYFIYQYPYEVGYTVTDNATGETIVAGKDGFLHEFIDLQALFGVAPTSVTVSYNQGAVHICELMLYSPGRVPSTVQQWKAPAEDKTDLLLFSTHGDDDQLFFAGILPYYAGALGYNVQVVYLTDHRNGTTVRVHEMLNGLWAVGCDVYPVFGDYPDFLEKTLKDTYAQFRNYGVSRDNILDFCTEQLRRFKPKVVVAHDFAGEYAHGQHMVYADCVAAALEISSDPSQLPESAELYGTWDVPKAYFHLYGENQIVMDWDTPMEELGGLSPFQVTQKYGFPCHESQQWTWFRGWINGKNGVVITRADQIATYSPCQYGLYRSTVGADTAKNDFFENVTTYAEDYERWLQENPPVTTPPDTTPPVTTPGSTTAPQNTPSQPAGTDAPSPDSPASGNQVPLICWLIFLGLLIGILTLLLILRRKK